MNHSLADSSGSEESPLLAAYAGSMDFLIPFLRAGGSASYANEHGDTLLHAAADGWQFRTVELLIISGALPNVQNSDDETPLHLIARSQKVPSEGAFITEKIPSDARLSTFRELLLRGAERHLVNSQGATPLHLAAWAGDSLAIRALATPTTIDQLTTKGATPLALAIVNGHVEGAGLLIHLGANITIELPTGRRPIEMIKHSENPRMRALAE